MKNKKMHKVMIVAIAVLVMVSCILPAAAAVSSENIIVIEGDVGEKFYVGNLVFEIVSDEEMDRVLSQPQTRASEKRWEITLSGTSMSKQRTISTQKYGLEMIHRKEKELYSTLQRELRQAPLYREVRWFSKVAIL